jgi:hypothetical protein
MSVPLPKESLNLESFGNLVKHWVHYDNSIAAINKQIRNLRDLKHTYETQILHMISAAQMKQPIIQIAGGRLVVGEDKSHQPLTFSMLEIMLDKYYASKPGSRPETKEILKFIRENRTSQATPCLKRHTSAKTRSDTSS